MVEKKVEDEAIAQLIDECLELRRKVEKEPWTDVESSIEDMTRRFVDKVLPEKDS